MRTLRRVVEESTPLRQADRQAARADGARLRPARTHRRLARDGAHHGRERHRQGGGGARAARARPAPGTGRSSPSTARRCRRRCSRASCSVTRAAPSPMRAPRAPGCSSRRTAARSCSTRSATCRSRCSRSSCARCRSARCVRSAATRRCPSTCASSPPPTAICGPLVEEERFREDLYFRINVIHVELPPLRARGGDVLLLAQHFVDVHAARAGKRVTGISPGAAREAARLQLAGQRARAAELHRAGDRAHPARADRRGRSARDGAGVPALARARRGGRSRRSWCRCPRSSGATSCAWSRPSAATRRRPPRSSGSPARPCTASSKNTAPRRVRGAPEAPGPGAPRREPVRIYLRLLATRVSY